MDQKANPDGCWSVKMGCQNGTSGTSTNHSDAEMKIAQGSATSASMIGCSRAVHRPMMPKKNSGQEKSALGERLCRWR